MIHSLNIERKCRTKCVLFDFWFLERFFLKIKMERNRTNCKNEEGINFGIFVLLFFLKSHFIFKGCEVGGSELEGG